MGTFNVALPRAPASVDIKPKYPEKHSVTFLKNEVQFFSCASLHCRLPLIALSDESRHTKGVKFHLWKVNYSRDRRHDRTKGRSTWVSANHRPALVVFITRMELKQDDLGLVPGWSAAGSSRGPGRAEAQRCHIGCCLINCYFSMIVSSRLVAVGIPGLIPCPPAPWGGKRGGLVLMARRLRIHRVLPLWQRSALVALCRTPR